MLIHCIQNLWKGRIPMHRLQSFFAGRNGADSLSRTTCILACLLLILSMFFHGVVSTVLWALALAFLVISYFRMLSRNIWKRRAENQKFLDKTAPIRKKVNQWKLRWRQRNLYAFFKCPQCGTVLRVPKGKGKIRVTCKNCSNVMEKNT